MTEHEKAIQESEQADAAEAYFAARQGLVMPKSALRAFDAGFDRGWAAHACQPHNFCPDCGQRTQPGFEHVACDPDGAVAFADRPRTSGYAQRISNGLEPLEWGDIHEKVQNVDTFEKPVQIPSKNEHDADGWIPWSGGKCPVALDVLVEIRLRRGIIYQGIAAGWVWRHHGFETDIVAYRIVKDRR